MTVKFRDEIGIFLCYFSKKKKKTSRAAVARRTN
jgi:hypothetical protein